VKPKHCAVLRLPMQSVVRRMAVKPPGTRSGRQDAMCPCAAPCEPPRASRPRARTRAHTPARPYTRTRAPHTRPRARTWFATLAARAGAGGLGHSLQQQQRSHPHVHKDNMDNMDITSAMNGIDFQRQGMYVQIKQLYRSVHNARDGAHLTVTKEGSDGPIQYTAVRPHGSMGHKVFANITFKASEAEPVKMYKMLGCVGSVMSFCASLSRVRSCTMQESQ
jgi:hypothetical protein